MAVASMAHGADPAAGPGDELPSGKKRTPYLLLLPGMTWLALLFLVPLAALFSTSLQKPGPGGGIGEYVPALRWQNYADSVGAYWEQFLRSFLYAGTATALALAIGFPLAYAIAFKAGRWRNILLVLVVAPFFTSFMLRTVAWRQILSDDGFVTPVLKSLHLVSPDAALTASTVGVIAGLTYNFLPFMTLPLYASLERMDPRLIEAGGDLYGSPFTVLRKVTIPLAMPGIVAGTLLTFIPAAGDYVNAELLGSRQNTMIGNVVQSRFMKVQDYPTAASLSFLLMLAILILVTLYIRRAGTEELL